MSTADTISQITSIEPGSTNTDTAADDSADFPTSINIENKLVLEKDLEQQPASESAEIKPTPATKFTDMPVEVKTVEPEPFITEPAIVKPVAVAEMVPESAKSIVAPSVDKVVANGLADKVESVPDASVTEAVKEPVDSEKKEEVKETTEQAANDDVPQANKDEVKNLESNPAEAVKEVAKEVAKEVVKEVAEEKVVVETTTVESNGEQPKKVEEDTTVSDEVKPEEVSQKVVEDSEDVEMEDEEGDDEDKTAGEAEVDEVNVEGETANENNQAITEEETGTAEVVEETQPTPKKRGRKPKKSAPGFVKRNPNASPAKKPLKSKTHYAPSDEELPAGLLEMPSTVEDGSKRIRKKTERLETSYESPSKIVEVLLPGNGQKLCEFESIDQAFADVHPFELKPLHRVIFQRFGSLNDIRRNLRQFNGFAFDRDSSAFEKRVYLLNRLTYKQLKRLCDFFHVSKSLSKEEQVEGIITFLMNPQFTDTLTKKRGTAHPRAKSIKDDDDDNSPSPAKGVGKETTLTPNGHIRKRRRTKAEIEVAREIEAAKKASITEAMSAELDSQVEDDGTPKATITPTGKVRRRRRTKAEMELAKNSEPARKQSRNDSTPDHKSSKPAKSRRSSPSSVKKAPKKDKLCPPSDDDLKEEIKRILYGANLEQITMKTVCRSVYDKFPEFDITPRKDFIKATVKMIIK